MLILYYLGRKNRRIPAAAHCTRLSAYTSCYNNIKSRSTDRNGGDTMLVVVLIHVDCGPTTVGHCRCKVKTRPEFTRFVFIVNLRARVASTPPSAGSRESNFGAPNDFFCHYYPGTPRDRVSA